MKVSKQAFCIEEELKELVKVTANVIAKLSTKFFLN